MSEVIVTNVAFEPLAVVSWKRAATMILSGSAYNLDGSQVVKTVFSPSLSINVHRVIHTKTYTYIPRKKITLDSYANRRIILERDNWTCAYCGKFGNTIDHVIPQCRGGKSTYGNQVASCKSCNNKKGHQTLNRAGMTLNVTPHVPDEDPYAEMRKELETIFSTVLS